MNEIHSPDMIHVFVNQRKLDLPTNEMTANQLVESAGFQGTGWDLLLLQGEGDRTGGELINSTTLLRLKNGEHFRIIPGNRTFGA